jgi:AAA domain, putative AbiEii toxin, Type IV TA system
MRDLLLNGMRFRHCYSFENRRKLFEIHSSFKFATVVAQAGNTTEIVSCAFYLHDDEWLFGKRSGRGALAYSIEFVRRTGGKYMSLLELRSGFDLEIAGTCFSNGETFGSFSVRHGVKMGEQFDASVMSDGTLRSLGILLALRQRPRPSIVLLDEIEDSLHPLAHGVLLDAIDEVSEEFPVVVSTHSPEILNNPVARADRIRVVERADGGSQVLGLSDNVRANLKPPLTVGQLLTSNALWTEVQSSTIGAMDDFF